jgi:hypothetical protein
MTDHHKANMERYSRLVAAMLKLPGLRINGAGYVEVQEVVRVLAEEFLTEQEEA